eukprot:668060-Pyramimonas_sp.AAC.1
MIAIICNPHFFLHCPPRLVDGNCAPKYVRKFVQERIDAVVCRQAPGVCMHGCERMFTVRREVWWGGTGLLAHG